MNGSQETIEEILAKAEEAGHRGDPGEITDPVGLKVKVSGVTPGYNRDEILAALKECGMKATDGEPAQSTKYLAIGDNVDEASSTQFSAATRRQKSSRRASCLRS